MEVRMQPEIKKIGCNGLEGFEGWRIRPRRRHKSQKTQGGWRKEGVVGGST